MLFHYYSYIQLLKQDTIILYKVRNGIKTGKKRRETEIKDCLNLSFLTSLIIPHMITFLTIELVSCLPLLNATEENFNNAQTSFPEVGFANIKRICALSFKANRKVDALSDFLLVENVCVFITEEKDPRHKKLKHYFILSGSLLQDYSVAALKGSKVQSNLTLKLFASAKTNQYHIITDKWTFTFRVDGNIREWKEIGWFPFCLVPLP